MRIISQDRIEDLPYQYYIISVVRNYIQAYSQYGEYCNLGEYSSKEKALKVMEMIRSQYKTNAISVSNNGGLVSHFTSFVESGNTYQYKSYFYMPQDNEV